MSGYNFDRLYKYAEILAEKVQTNRRVTDVGIELGNSDYWQMQDEAASELYIKYDMEKVALHNLNLRQCYATLAALMDKEMSAPIVTKINGLLSTIIRRSAISSTCGI